MTGSYARTMFASVLLTLLVTGAAAQTGARLDLTRAEQGNAEAQCVAPQVRIAGVATVIFS